MTFKLAIFRLIALALAAFVLWDAWHFPVAPGLVAAGLALYFIVLLFEVRVWLLMLPAAIAAISLAYWSGRYFWDVFDLFVLMTLAGGLWSRIPWWPRQHAWRMFWPLAIFFVLQVAITLNGLYPLQAPVPQLWDDYFASTNALREAKGFLWAFLLLPMVMQAQRAGSGAARWLVAGMVFGLLATVLTILWERNLYTGIMNFGHEYRVSGWFFDIHTGGAAIDVALALTFPFVLGLWVWWRRWPVHATMLAMLLFGAYGLFVTFSRANYPAVGVMLMTLVIGALTTPGVQFERKRYRGAKAYVVVGLLLALTPVIMGGTIAARFETTWQDLQTRLSHWATGITLVNDGNEHWFGAGKGVFPLRYHLMNSAPGRHLATMFLHRSADGNFFRFSESDKAGSMYLRQRFSPSDEPLQLHLTARTAPGAKARILIEFCERHILRVRKECKWVGINVADTNGEWQTYHRKINLGQLGQGDMFNRSPLDVSLLHRGIKSELDIGEVRLVTAIGRDLLRNPDFQQGLDYWFMSDGQHLRWHAKNIFVHVYIESGVLGLSLFIMLLVVAVYRSWRLHRRGDPLGVFFAASILAGVSVGLFDSILDAPRVTVLFILLISAASVWRPVPVTVANTMVSYPGWLPRPAVLTSVLLAGLLAVSAVRLIVKSGMNFGQTMLALGDSVGIDPRNLFDFANSLPDGYEAGERLQPRETLPRIWRDVPSRQDSEVCGNTDVKFLASCWRVTRNHVAGKEALAALVAMGDVKPRSYNQYGNGWELAVVYDLLSDHPSMTADVETALQRRLQRVLSDYLLVLNSDGPAVWHGRATLAAQAMIIGSVLKPDTAFAWGLLEQAHFHYRELLEALSVSEAWPEGYNYWVNSRGQIITLAGYAYVNAFRAPPALKKTREVFRRIGSWQIHNTRPDLKAVQIGDEGPRIDLREDTVPAIDLIHAISPTEELTVYSDMLTKKFGKRAYYKGYRWLRPLVGREDVEPSASLKGLTSLPTADWFGEDAMNLLYMRSDWSGDATMLSYRAGHNLSHHGHYDAGHFTLFKGAPLAVTGATYRGQLSAGHRLDYGVRTVSKNSLLVMRPGEVVQPPGYERSNKADGGQRLTMPLKNPLTTLDSWRENLSSGLHLNGGSILDYQHVPESFTYVKSDLTNAYNTPEHDEGGSGGKVESVLRELLYLRRLDRVLVRDRILTVKPDYKAKWLLQTINRPEIENGMVLQGAIDDGITATDQSAFRFANKSGRLHVLSLLPRTRETLVIGGEKHLFYTDFDGDARTLDGKLMGHSSRKTKWFDFARWRLEISTRESTRQQDFLTLLSPSRDEFNEPEAELLNGLPNGVLGLRVDDEVIVFVDDASVTSAVLPAVPAAKPIRMVGLAAGRPILWNGTQVTVTEAGVTSFQSGGQAGNLSWSTRQ